MPRAPKFTVEPEEHRWLLQAQTARNLEGLEAEQAGNPDLAVSLYERNAAEGFPGDWPYGRLIAIYEKREAFDDAERIMERAIEVISTSTTRTPPDRRSLARVFKNRLALLRKKRKSKKPAA
jgi:hypothetical protein